MHISIHHLMSETSYLKTHKIALRKQRLKPVITYSRTIDYAQAILLTNTER
jgi:hypothetical protein